MSTKESNNFVLDILSGDRKGTDILKLTLCVLLLELYSECPHFSGSHHITQIKVHILFDFSTYLFCYFECNSYVEATEILRRALIFRMTYECGI